MKLIIAGSRNYPRALFWKQLQESNIITLGVTEIVSGCASGPDSWGMRYAYENNIPVARFPADWSRHGRSAGMIRNKQMLDYGTALLAFWDGKSTGTEHMIRIAGERGIPVFICRPPLEKRHGA